LLQKQRKNWAGIHKTTYEQLTIIILVGLPYPKSDHANLEQPFAVIAPLPDE